MQVLYFCSCSHWKNMTILPHFSPYGQSSKTKSGMELAKVAHVRQSLMWCSLSHSSGNSPHSPFLTESTMALTSISRFLAQEERDVQGGRRLLAAAARRDLHREALRRR